MFTSNPFAELSASIPPSVMQAYVVVMFILVAVLTFGLFVAVYAPILTTTRIGARAPR